LGMCSVDVCLCQTGPIVTSPSFLLKTPCLFERCSGMCSVDVRLCQTGSIITSPSL
jgi:hypothetical protein